LWSQANLWRSRRRDAFARAFSELDGVVSGCFYDDFERNSSCFADFDAK
jgi:hypothetical protein